MGYQEAVVFQIDCGASTNFNSQISVVAKAKASPKKSDKSFVVADDNHGSVADANLYYKGGPKFRVTWMSENELNVLLPKGARTFKKESSSDHLKISYGEYE